MALLRSFATVGSATMASRVLGFVREVMIASLLGTGPVADAFYAAFSVPNLFRRFLAEGAFNSAFVPLFAKELENGGQDGARRFAETVFAVLVAVLLILTALLEIFMPSFIDLIVPGFRLEPEKRELTVAMARIMMPYLFCLSLVAMLSGILNSLRRYFLAAIAPVLLNVVLIATLSGCFMAGTGNSAASGYALSWAVLVAGVVQLACLLAGVRREGFTFAVKMPRLTPGVKRLLVLAAPAALSAGIVQINLFVGRIIASGKDGAIATLNYADRIYQLPLGVVGIAIGVVLLPELSRALKGGRMEQAREVENRSLEFALLLTLPAAAALCVIPDVIIRGLYEHGAFTADDTRTAARVLMAFGLGLPSFVLIKVFSPGFFAREDTRTPMIFAGVGAAVNVAGSLILFPLYDEVGIAVATSIAGWVNALLLFAALARRDLWTFDAEFVRRVPRILASAAIMAATLFAGAMILADLSRASAGLAANLLALGLLVAGGAAVYFAAAYFSGGMDKASLRRALRR